MARGFRHVLGDRLPLREGHPWHVFRDPEGHGYGDVVPITIGGRIFTFVILMIGLGIIAIPSGMISSALTEARNIEKKERESDENE